MIKIHKKSLKILVAFALAISVLVPLVNIYVVFPSFLALVIQEAEEDSVRLAQHLSMMLVGGEEKLSPQRVGEWAKKENDSILNDFHIFKLKIYTPTGEIIYSSKAEEFGAITKKTFFHEIVAKGNVFTKTVENAKKTLGGEVSRPDVVETYVPILKNSLFLGALEIHQDITETLNKINRVLYLAAGLPLAVMIVFIIGFVFGMIKLDKYIQNQDETEQKLKNQQIALEKEKEEQLVLFKKVEQAKREWESTMDCIEDMVMLTDTSFKINRCNKAVLSYTGLSYGEILNKRFVDIFPDRENSQEECFEKGCEYYNKPTDQWFFITVYPLKNHEEKVVAIVITLHDLTEVKKVSIALKETNIEIDDNRMKLEDALGSISSLISKVVTGKTFDVLFKNPTLKQCFEVKQCGKNDCPCYGKEPMRCWQEQGTFCATGDVPSDGVKRECMQCDHYLETIDDPIYQIGEQFNNMMFILAAKNKEVEKAYAELKVTQGSTLR